MNFTREDILKIKWALDRYSVKDSELLDADFPMQYNDTISIVLNGVNKKISIKEFIWQVGLLAKDDIFNVTDIFNKPNITLNEAIKIIPYSNRKEGLVITFLDENGEWRIYQFRGDITQFNNETLWKDLYDFTEYIVNSVLPDEEDLTKESTDDKGNYVTKFKDKEYDPENFSGMATKILRKNIIEVNGIKKNILTLNDFDLENCIYEIRYDFDLNRLTITIPNNCILKFNGGCINSGTIIGDNTIIDAKAVKIFNLEITLSGTWNLEFYPEWIGAKGDLNSDDSLYFLWLSDTDIPFCIKLTRLYYIKNSIIVNRTKPLIMLGSIKYHRGNNIINLHVDAIDLFTILLNTYFVMKNVYLKLITVSPDTIIFNGKICGHISNCIFENFGSAFNNIYNVSIIENNIFYLLHKHFIVGMIVDSCVKNNYINSSRTNHSWAVSSVNSTVFSNNFIDFWKYFYIHNRNTTTSSFVGNLFDNIFRVFVGGHNITVVGNKFSNIDYSVNNWTDLFLDEDMKTKPWAVFATLDLSTEFPDMIQFNGRLVSYVNISNNVGHDKVNTCYFELKMYLPYKLTIKNNLFEEAITDYNFSYTSSERRTDCFIFIDSLMYKEYETLPNPIINSTAVNVVFNKQIIKVGLLLYINIYGVWNKYKEVGIVNGTTSKRPNLTSLDVNYTYYDTTLNKNIIWNGTEWVNLDGSSLNNTGTTENRPTTALNIGFIYKDTTLGKLIMWEGTKWVNIDGTELG